MALKLLCHNASLARNLSFFPFFLQQMGKKSHPSRVTSVSTSHLHTPVLVLGGQFCCQIRSPGKEASGLFFRYLCFHLCTSCRPHMPPHDVSHALPAQPAVVRPQAPTDSWIFCCRERREGPRVHPITNSNEVENSPALETAEGSSPIMQPSPR